MKTLPECAGCPGVLDNDTYDLSECVGCDTLPAELQAAAMSTPDPDVVATAKTGWKTPREIANEYNPDPRLAKQEQATDIGRAIAYLLNLEFQHQGDEYYTYETAPGYGTKNYAGLARFVGRIFSDHKFLAQLIKDAEALPGEGSRSPAPSNK